MIHTINNGIIELSVADSGGEMMSIKYTDAEYLWQGDPQYWDERAINLFPVNGRLKDGKYTYEGNSYKMGIHGFIKRSILECVEKTDNSMIFELKSNEMTRAEYPFEFLYRVGYELKDNSIVITYNVENLQSKPIYFCLGGHPGFNVPLDGAGEFSDYYLEFDCVAQLKRIGFDKACLLSGEKFPYSLKDGRILPLAHSLFDDDAIFFEDMCSAITLRSAITERSVRVDYKDMKYLGLWHKPRSDAPYICIEPWQAMPSYGDRIDDITTKQDVIALNKGEIYQNAWSIALT
ncbi:MAG: aldose 1-epimerase family protein [Clostridia bacterium]|nr:aldose 1-epimerase family protein [Clostridia bacterium]